MTGQSIDSLKDADAEDVIRLSELIGAVMDEVVAVVSDISIDGLDAVAARLIYVQ